MTVSEAAVGYIERPLFVVPVDYREKGPKLAEWPALRITKADVPKYFNGAPQNIGIILGEPYGVSDIDLDCPEATSASANLAPATGFIFGRKSAPASHRFYRSDPPVRSKKYADPLDKKSLVELRCLKGDGTVGLQTVVPPSTHKETGEKIHFQPGFDGAPANIEAADLQRAVARIAAAALLARHWPAKGRHACELALAGTLARAGWNIEDAEQFALATYGAVATHDRDAFERVRASVRDTFRKHAAGEPTTGKTGLTDYIDRRVAATALKWLGIEQTRPEPSPEEPTPAYKGRTERRAAAKLVATDGYEVFKGDYPEPVFLIADLLTAGVTLFCGRPKIGKSWFTLLLAIAVALSKKFLGHFNVERPGRVTYIGLEESASRTHRRLRKLIATPDVGLQNIGFIYHLEPLLAGGAAQLDEYLAANPSELVVVDSLLSILQASGKRDVLRSDYAEVNTLRQIAEKHHTAMVIVHHSRKMGADNHVDTVAGTTGVTAGCDAIWSMKRIPSGDFVMEITGREMADKTYGLRFSQGEPFGWHLFGEGAEVGLSEERQEILELLKDEAPLKPAKIATMLRKNAVAVRRLLQKLYADGFIEKNRDGSYVLANLPEHLR